MAKCSNSEGSWRPGNGVIIAHNEANNKQGELENVETQISFSTLLSTSVQQFSSYERGPDHYLPCNSMHTVLTLTLIKPCMSPSLQLSLHSSPVSHRRETDSAFYMLQLLPVTEEVVNRLPVKQSFRKNTLLHEYTEYWQKQAWYENTGVGIDILIRLYSHTKQLHMPKLCKCKRTGFMCVYL